jgi:kinesin family member 18/19
MLLKDSIGGNCRTTMIACISPSQDFCKESNNTLLFAHSCKQIQNIIKPNRYKNYAPASMPQKIKKVKNEDVPWKSN